MAFLVFIGFLYPPPAWKVFLSGQKSSPKDFLLVVVVYAWGVYGFPCADILDPKAWTSTTRGRQRKIARGQTVKN